MKESVNGITARTRARVSCIVPRAHFEKDPAKKVGLLTTSFLRGFGGARRDLRNDVLAER